MTNEEKKLEEKLAKDGREKRVVTLQLNPSCHIEAEYKGKNFMQLPLFYMIESFMKDYNYEPELKIEEPLKIKIVISSDIVLELPLYVKKDNSKYFHSNYTLEQLVQKGYLLPSKRVIVPNPKLLQSNNQDEGGKNDAETVH